MACTRRQIPASANMDQRGQDTKQLRISEQPPPGSVRVHTNAPTTMQTKAYFAKSLISKACVSTFGLHCLKLRLTLIQFWAFDELNRFERSSDGSQGAEQHTPQKGCASPAATDLFLPAPEDWRAECGV